LLHWRCSNTDNIGLEPVSDYLSKKKGSTKCYLCWMDGNPLEYVALSIYSVARCSPDSKPLETLLYGKPLWYHWTPLTQSHPNESGWIWRWAHRNWVLYSGPSKMPPSLFSYYLVLPPVLIQPLGMHCSSVCTFLISDRVSLKGAFWILYDIISKLPPMNIYDIARKCGEGVC
jgi:hypothetical protein